MAEIFATAQRRRKSSLVFPNEPKTDRGEFLRFVEKSGLAAVIQEVLEALQAARDRPDDPIHWIRNYLRSKAPRRTAELNGIIESLRNDILDLETEIHNSNVFKEIQEENKALRSKFWYPQKAVHQFPVDKTYVEGGGDEIWQVKPDPAFKPPAPLDPTPPPPEEDGDVANTEFLNALLTPAPASRVSLTARRTPRMSLEDSVEGWTEPVTESLSPLCKSTETSPQPSLEKLVAAEPEAEELEVKSSLELLPPIEKDLRVQKPLPLPVIEDEDFQARRIPPTFWKQSFDLTTFGTEKQREWEEEAGEDYADIPTSLLLRGPDLKKAEIPENSWLPNHDSGYHVRRNSLYSQLDKYGMPNAVPIEWADRFRGSLGGERHLHPPHLTKQQKRGLKLLEAQRREKQSKTRGNTAAVSDSAIPITDYEWSKKPDGAFGLRRLTKDQGQEVKHAEEDYGHVTRNSHNKIFRNFSIN